MKLRISLLVTFVLSSLQVIAQDEGVFRAAGTPEKPSVPVSWNRYYNYDGITAI